MENPRKVIVLIDRMLKKCILLENKVENKDAILWLKSLPDNSVDLFVTDPAYQSLEKHRDNGTSTRLIRWFDIFTNDKFPELFAEMFRVLKPCRHAYVYCDQETAFIIKPMAEEAGFKFWKPIIWDKIHIGMGYHYRARYEFIMFFEKGKRQLNDLGIPDILQAKRIRGRYPTEKPVEISDILINQSTDEGFIVADPFCGSGSVAEAAVKSGRIFWGTDTSKEAVNLTAGRMARR